MTMPCVVSAFFYEVFSDVFFCAALAASAAAFSSATRSLNTRVGITIEEEQAQIAAQKEAERKAVCIYCGDFSACVVSIA